MTTTRQNLPPCCHAVRIGKKDTPKVRFKSELTKFAVASGKDEVSRLAFALTEARSALQLDRSGYDASKTASRFNQVDDIQGYVSSVTSYLSLVKGFTVAPVELVSVAKPPVTEESLVSHLPAEGSATPAASLQEPLIGSTSTAVDTQSTRSKCLSFCNWKDVLTSSSIYTMNARIEYAQCLLASGLLMMEEASVKVDVMLAERVTEINENDLKIAYQLFLHAAGLFEACLTSINIPARAIGAEATDLSVEPTKKTEEATPVTTQVDESALAKWREEQRNTNSSSTTVPTSAPTADAAGTSAASSEDLSVLKRLPDLVNGRFPQLLAWISLAEAQELVVLRGMSREFVDYSLMAKLSMDLSMRYKECHAFTARQLPCATSSVAERIRLYCTFKDAYYAAVSCYFQGAACMEKGDAKHCAQAIADLKKASTLIQQATQRKAAYDAKLTSRDEKDRLFAIKTVYVRTEQIIQRDLHIMTQRNDSVYYERIPEPQHPCEPLGLVRVVALPAVGVHPIWYEKSVATCLHPSDPHSATNGGAHAANGTSATTRSPTTEAHGSVQESGPRRDSCCNGCVIS
ncbi:hypothetical protein Poli38472_012484 [Pythium oligandrum]|uniref:BRO1 domain-containing protein n=1 Tax=Pythium oligandrum TaxID=41045 RepID=A0A8K1CQY9_PYTOL|nr:hypothetical protein Poli38472_012484 [Pythium oligandrum]|eukprot:TMW67368.1 hypothetical protein Poli38472_012484 [Pythium oligandrum]